MGVWPSELGDSGRHGEGGDRYRYDHQDETIFSLKSILGPKFFGPKGTPTFHFFISLDDSGCGIVDVGVTSGGFTRCRPAAVICSLCLSLPAAGAQ